MHAIIVYGFPSSISFLNFQSKRAIYNIAGYDFSLLEIEHAILRGSTHHPSGLMGMGSLLPEFDPSDPRVVFRSTSRDPRIGFLLTFCTSSNPRVRVLTPANFEEELNRGVVMYLSQYLEIDEKKKQLWLPKICDWYWKDFGKEKYDMVQWLAETNFRRPDLEIPGNVIHFQNFFKENPIRDYEIKFFKYEWNFNLIPLWEYGPEHILSEDYLRETVLNDLPIMPLYPNLDPRVYETVFGPPKKGIEDPKIEPQQSASNSYFAQSISTYPVRDKETQFKDGHPIADSYAFLRMNNRVIFALADGCGWGKGPREASHIASQSFVNYIQAHMTSAVDTRALGRLLFNALNVAHHSIIFNKSREELYHTGTTTICGGLCFQIIQGPEVAEHADNHFPNFEEVMGANYCNGCKFGRDCQGCKAKIPSCWEKLGCPECRPELREDLSSHWPQASALWGVALLSIGDCKAYHYKKQSNSIVEITKGNRMNIDDPTDPGGRIGAHTFDPVLPDLRNLRLIFTTVQEGDHIYLCSDGIHDNLDPQILGIDPGDFGIKISLEKNQPPYPPSWDELVQLKKKDPPAYSSIELLKSKWSAMKMQSLISPETPKMPSEVEYSHTNYEGRQRGLTSLGSDNPEFLSQINRLELHGQRLMDHCLRVTQNQRHWMETETQKVPEDYKKYPGKLDHTTLLCFQVTEQDKLYCE